MQKENSKRRKPKGKPPETITVHLPAGAPSSKFEALSISDESMADIGVLVGDIAIIYRTSDIQSGDIICHKTTKGERRIGRYYAAPGGRIHLEPLSDEYDPEIFAADEGKILGRVTHFERDEQEIEVKTKLRSWQQAKVKTDARSAEIERLETKLMLLKELGDITDSTQCFQIEKRIYDLKRELARDEWPEVIGDE